MHEMTPKLLCWFWWGPSDLSENRG